MAAANLASAALRTVAPTPLVLAADLAGSVANMTGALASSTQQPGTNTLPLVVNHNYFPVTAPNGMHPVIQPPAASEVVAPQPQTSSNWKWTLLKSAVLLTAATTVTVWVYQSFYRQSPISSSQSSSSGQETTPPSMSSEIVNTVVGTAHSMVCHTWEVVRPVIGWTFEQAGFVTHQTGKAIECLGNYLNANSATTSEVALPMKFLSYLSTPSTTGNGTDSSYSQVVAWATTRPVFRFMSRCMNGS